MPKKSDHTTRVIYLLLAVALLAVSSLRAVTLLGRRSLVVAGRCSLGGLARGGGGLALAVTLLLVVAARGVALFLLRVAATVAAAVAALLLLVVAAAVALLAAVASPIATATALSAMTMWTSGKTRVTTCTRETLFTPADKCTSCNMEPNPQVERNVYNPAKMHLPTVASSVASATVTASTVTPVTLQHTT